MANGFRIVPDKKGIRQLMNSKEMTSFLKEVAKDMTGGDERYDIQVWKGPRPGRVVVNIRDKSPNARWFEVHHGNLQRMAVTYIHLGGGQ